MGVGASGIEIRILNTNLAPLLPPAMATAILSANHRSWVRAVGFSKSAPSVIADYGPGATSYRLIDTPYALERPSRGLLILFLAVAALFLRARASLNGGPGRGTASTKLRGQASLYRAHS